MATLALAGSAMENQTARVRPTVLQEDFDALTALQAIANYTPTNTANQHRATRSSHSHLRVDRSRHITRQYLGYEESPVPCRIRRARNQRLHKWDVPF